MRISATGNKREAGFTLIELMVVVTIIAIASAVVVLATPDPRGRLVDEAERFAARTLAARDDAIVQSRDTRVWVSANGYGVERRRRGAWQPAVAKPFTDVRWAEGTGALVGTAGRQRITFDATGAAAPAVITLVRDSARATVSVSANGAVRVGS